MVANCAIVNGMLLISNEFQHKKINIGTCTTPDYPKVNLIVHVKFSKELE